MFPPREFTMKTVASCSPFGFVDPKYVDLFGFVRCDLDKVSVPLRFLDEFLDFVFFLSEKAYAFGIS